jgi:hypothetical protein
MEIKTTKEIFNDVDKEYPLSKADKWVRVDDILLEIKSICNDSEGEYGVKLYYELSEVSNAKEL